MPSSCTRRRATSIPSGVYIRLHRLDWSMVPPRSIIPLGRGMFSSSQFPSKMPSYPLLIPSTRQPCWIAVLAMARIAGFIPGASPPDVKTPIVFIVCGCCLWGIKQLNLGSFKKKLTGERILFEQSQLYRVCNNRFKLERATSHWFHGFSRAVLGGPLFLNGCPTPCHAA